MIFYLEQNIPSLEIFNKFNQKYGSIIDSKFSIIKDVELYVTDINNLKIIQNYNKYFSETDFEDSPYASHADYKFIIDNTYKCTFSDEEKMALIAHELWHIILGLNKQSTDDLQEEESCDKFSFDLGLGKYLITALEKTKIYLTKPAINNYPFAPKPISNPCAELDERIKILQLLLKLKRCKIISITAISILLVSIIILILIKL